MEEKTKTPKQPKPAVETKPDKSKDAKEPKSKKQSSITQIKSSSSYKSSNNVYDDVSAQNLKQLSTNQVKAQDVLEISETGSNVDKKDTKRPSIGQSVSKNKIQSKKKITFDAWLQKEEENEKIKTKRKWHKPNKENESVANEQRPASKTQIKSSKNIPKKEVKEMSVKRETVQPVVVQDAPEIQQAKEQTGKQPEAKLEEKISSEEVDANVKIQIKEVQRFQNSQLKTPQKQIPPQPKLKKAPTKQIVKQKPQSQLKKEEIFEKIVQQNVVSLVDQKINQLVGKVGNQQKEANKQPQGASKKQQSAQIKKVLKAILKNSSKLNSQTKGASPQQSPIVKSLRQIPQKEGGGEFDTMSRKTCETFRSTRSSCEDYLGQVFNYYCRLTYQLGNHPTFREIEQKVQTMIVTNFMLFCQDFKIRDKLPRQTIIGLFKKYAQYQRYLNNDQFHELIRALASEMYPEFDYQKRYSKLLRFLELHNSLAFVKKMAQLGPNFRFKNKRGAKVTLSKKYEYRLTTVNGKSLEQLDTEVKERSQIRKEIKQKNIESCRQNKTNKSELLFQRMRNKQRHLKSSSALNKNTLQLGLNASNYYNPCEILSPSRGNTYSSIFKVKKGLHEHANNTGEYSRHHSIARQSKEFKMNKVIALAKNQLKQTHAHEIDKLKANQKAKSAGNELNAIELIAKNFDRILDNPNLSRKSKQLRLAEFCVESLIQSMPAFTETKSKQFMRATAKVNKDNSIEMYKLEQMIGVNDFDRDELLEKHYNMQMAQSRHLANLSTYGNARVV